MEQNGQEFQPQQPTVPMQTAAQVSIPAKAQQPPPPQYLLDTLNESVCQTITRDLKLMGLRTLQVIWIFKRPSNPEVYEQWDIFGPLFYSLTLALLNYFTYLQVIGNPYFILTTIIAVVFLLGFVISINIKLIGGKSNMLGTVSLLGYACAPLVIGSIVVLVLVCSVNVLLVRSLASAGVIVVCAIWSVLATISFFRNVAPQGKVTLAIYPVIFYFVVLAMLTVMPATGKIKKL